MIGLKTRIKEMKKLGMTEIKVDIETLEGLLEQRPETGQVDAIVSSAEWISVDDKLPEEETAVLVKLTTGFKSIAFLRERGFNNTLDWFAQGAPLKEGNWIDKVEKWMPLP